MLDTLDSLHREFATYRQAHRRGAYPLQLRQRAVGALEPHELLELAARLGLTAAQVRRWGKKTVAPHEAPAFFEVPVAPVQASMPQVCVEVEMPSGTKLRLHGHVDAAILSALVAALHAVAA